MERGSYSKRKLIDGSYKKPRKPRPKQCSACLHNQRPKIDKDLILGMSMRVAADKYGLTKDIMNRHNKGCIDEAQRRKVIAADVRDQQVTEQQQIAGVLNDERVEVQSGLKRCIKEIETILEKAKEQDDDPLALASIREMRQTLIDLAKVYGQLKTSLTVNVALTDSPEWLELRAILTRVFSEHEQAGRMFIDEARKLNVSLPSPR